MSNTQNPFQKILKERKEKQMLQGGKQKLVGYSGKQRLIFCLLYFIAWFFEINIYNSYAVFRDGFLSTKEREINPLIVFGNNR